MNSRHFTDQGIKLVIEDVYEQTKFLPTLNECRLRGIVCGTGRFFLIRDRWAAEQEPEPKPRTTTKRCRPLTPETINSAVEKAQRIHQRVPVEPVTLLTDSQRAIREYMVATRRVGLSRARGTK